MRLIDVYTRHDAPAVLYMLLSERTPDQSISHVKMPSEDAHLKFFRSKPYLDWCLIEDDQRIVGSVYLTKNREIGIFIFKKYGQSGYGAKAVQLLIQKWPGRVLANANPRNEASRALFISLGFRELQVTFVKD